LKYRVSLRGRVAAISAGDAVGGTAVAGTTVGGTVVAGAAVGVALPHALSSILRAAKTDKRIVVRFIFFILLNE
jgi:hypothetical protein